jgi:hypothetical protein
MMKSAVARALQGESLPILQPMRFTIEFGDKEKHRLEYSFNQLIGRLVIKVNERPIKITYRLMNEPLKEVHVFQIGRFEKTLVRIEKQRKQLFGHLSRVFVNNRLVKVVGNE